MEILDVRVAGNEIKLAPVGDIQFGSANCDVPKLARHIQYGVDHGWWFLGMGDYLDHFSPSNRRALVEARAGTLYDSARQLLDEAVEERLNGLVREALAPSVGRWLGLVKGDHEWTFDSGLHGDEALARKLSAPYLQTSTLLHVYTGACPVPLRVLAFHGRGASVSSTGKTLHLERLMQGFDADVYLMGHAHLKYGVPLDRMEVVTYPDGRRDIINRTKILGITGSFFNGYSAGKSSYVEEAALRPVSTGGLLIEARPIEEEWGWRWDMFVTA